MKALSVQQPWADLIMRGKDVENRSWSTSHRGPLLIHAGTTLRPGPWLRRGYGPNHEWELGGVVGIVDLVDCVQGHESPWAAAGAWHWVLANPRRVPFMPWKGTLGLFEIPWPPAAPTSSRAFRRDERAIGDVPDLFQRIVPIEEIARVLPIASLHAVVGRAHEPALAGDETQVREGFARLFRTRLNTVLAALEPGDKKLLLASAALSARQSLDAWAQTLGGTEDEDFADDPQEGGSGFDGDEGDPDDLDFDTDYAHPDVAEKLGVKREDGFLYYFADGNVMRMPQDGGEGELVVATHVKPDDDFFTFIDENGDVARCRRTRRHGLPVRAPLVSTVLAWIAVDGGREILAYLSDARSLKRRKKNEDMEAQLAASYRGDLEALIDDLRRDDLVALLGSEEGVEVGDSWYRLADAEAKSLEALRAIAKEALCRLQTDRLVLGASPDDDDAEDETSGDADVGAAENAEDPAVAALRQRLSEYTGRRSIEVRSLLKKAGLGEFSRLRTDRFQELRELVDAAGFVLCDEAGAAFSADAISPGIDARVRVRPKGAQPTTEAPRATPPPSPALSASALPDTTPPSSDPAPLVEPPVAAARAPDAAEPETAGRSAATTAISNYELAVARLRLLTGVAWPERRASSFWPGQFLRFACDRQLEPAQHAIIEMLCDKLAAGAHDPAPAVELLRSAEQRGRLAALVDAFELLNDGAAGVEQSAIDLRVRLGLLGG